MKVSFLLWNVNRKDLTDLVIAVVQDSQSCIVILLEASGINLDRLSQALAPSYVSFTEPVLDAVDPASVPARILARNDLLLQPLTAESQRMIAVKVTGALPRPVILVAVHLPDKTNNRDQWQSMGATVYAQRIRELESREGSADTIVVGDFNMNPYEWGMTDWRGFNAVPTREEAKCRVRTKENVAYPYFYNPCWGLFSDLNGMAPGTYYYANSDLRWNVFDQVLIRPSLITCFEDRSLRVLDRAGTTALRTKAGLPDKAKASDHLPVAFSLNFGGCP